MRRRRNALGLTQQDVAADDGPSTATLREIEKGLPNDRHTSTYYELERILGWTRGDAQVVLNGGEPTIQAVPSNAPPGLPGSVIDAIKADPWLKNESESVKALIAHYVGLVKFAKLNVRMNAMDPTSPEVAGLFPSSDSLTDGAVEDHLEASSEGELTS